MLHRFVTALRAHSRRIAILTVSASLALPMAACGGVDIYPQTIFEPRSEYATEGLDLFVLIIWAGVIVGVLVEIALLWVAWQYRRRANDRLPPQIHGNTTIEIIWTSAPAVALAFILWPTIQMIFKHQAPAPADALQITVVGHQFWWEFQYPDGNVVTANEMHMPVGRTANLKLLSDDVIHSFWVPALGGKRDAFPGHTNHIWMTPNTVGRYPGQCYQLCGYSHGNMREWAVVQSQADFDAWLRAQQQPAVAPTDAAAQRGAQVFTQKGCGGRHVVTGTPAAGKVGPNLTHVGSRATIAGSVLDNTPDGLRTWLRDPPGVKPGSLMPNLNLNDEEITALVAYLQALK